MWWTNHAKGFALYSIIFLFNIRYGIECQRTWLDDRFVPLLRDFRILLRHATDPASENAHKLNLLKQRGVSEFSLRYSNSFKNYPKFAFHLNAIYRSFKKNLDILYCRIVIRKMVQARVVCKFLTVFTAYGREILI